MSISTTFSPLGTLGGVTLPPRDPNGKAIVAGEGYLVGLAPSIIVTKLEIDCFWTPAQTVLYGYGAILQCNSRGPRHYNPYLEAFARGMLYNRGTLRVVYEDGKTVCSNAADESMSGEGQGMPAGFNNMKLFGYPSEPYTGMFYSLKIWRGDTLVADIAPGTDGKIYDFLNRKELTHL